MNWVRDKLSSIGIFLIIAGILSSVLQLIGYELRIFRAINAQGPAVAWGIRGGCFAVGLLLFLVADRGEKAHATDAWGEYRRAGLGDPRMRTFLDLVRARTGAAVDAVAGTPRVAHFTFTTQTGEVIPAGDPRAAFLIAYVEGPQRMQLAQNVQSGEISQTELSSLQWDAVVH